jgi:hypothetical protein
LIRGIRGGHFIMMIGIAFAIGAVVFFGLCENLPLG